MLATQLLEQAESEARRLAAASDEASSLFHALRSQTAAVLAERLAAISKLAREAGSAADRTRADMEKFLPTLIDQLRSMTSAVEQLVTAGTPLLELGQKLESTVPQVS